LNRNARANEIEEKIRTDRANIDREDLGEEAPQIVEEDEDTLKAFREAEQVRKLQEERLRKEEEDRERESLERAQLLEKYDCHCVICHLTR
jgi:hypothetical protein